MKLFIFNSLMIFPIMLNQIKTLKFLSTAVTCNHNPHVIKSLASLGANFDCSSKVSIVFNFKILLKIFNL